MVARYTSYKEGVKIGIAILYDANHSEWKKWKSVAEAVKDGNMVVAAAAVHAASQKPLALSEDEDDEGWSSED